MTSPLSDKQYINLDPYCYETHISFGNKIHLQQIQRYQSVIQRKQVCYRISRDNFFQQSLPEASLTEGQEKK